MGMRMKVVQFIAIITTALYLVPTGAHLFELPNKIALSPTEYLTVQKIYAGWSLFGIVIGIALLATLAHTLMSRADRTSFALSFGAFVTLVATQGLFWAFTYPVNAATGFLDGASRIVRGGTMAMGILACGKRCAHVCRARRDCPGGTHI